VSGSLSGNGLFDSLPAIINEARLIVHQFLDPPEDDSDASARLSLTVDLDAINQMLGVR
jgi:hypothetical protein